MARRTEKDFGETCYQCAIKNGGVPVPWPVTMWSDVCPYCKKTKSLRSTGDFAWPKKGKKAVWD